MVVVIVVMMMMLAKGFFEARVSEPEEKFLEKFPGEIFCADVIRFVRSFTSLLLCLLMVVVAEKNWLKPRRRWRPWRTERPKSEKRGSQRYARLYVCVCVCVRVYFRVCGFSHICVFAVCVFACARVSPIVFCGKRLPQNSDGGPRRHDR